MSSPIVDVHTKAYIDSESEFNYVRLRGFLEHFMGFITGHDMHLLSFDEVVEKLRLSETHYRGLQDIPIAHIVGSTGRYEEFTRHFFPRSFDKRDKERWRNIYTLAVTGKGFPPIDLYQIDQVYFVKDGNHRVSVARDLGWETIQANITELPCAISLEPHVQPDDLLIKEECAYFLERTKLDKNRPVSKEHIDFTRAGSYQNLLHHINLQQRLMLQRAGNADTDIESAAVYWFDNTYLPLVAALRESRIMEQFPKRSESDLYMWLIENQVELRQRHDFEALALPDVVAEFLNFMENVDKCS